MIIVKFQTFKKIMWVFNYTITKFKLKNYATLAVTVSIICKVIKMFIIKFLKVIIDH